MFPATHLIPGRTLCATGAFHPIARLWNSNLDDSLGKIAGPVDVDAVLECHEVAEQLQRNHPRQREQKLACLIDGNDIRGERSGLVVSSVGESDDPRPLLLHVFEEL